MKDINRRIGKLERKFEPQQRLIPVLDTPENRALVAEGLMPDNPVVPAEYQTSRSKRGQKQKLVRRRLGKRDMVIFMSELEMAA